MPQLNQEDFFEVDLSDRKDEPRKEYLDNLIEVNFSKEKLTFKEKMQECESRLNQIMDEHKVFSFMERRNLLTENVEVEDSDFIKTRKHVEKEYVKLICDCTDEEYDWWRADTLNLLIYSLHPEHIKAKAEKGSSDLDINNARAIDPDHAGFRLELFKKAMEKRERLMQEKANVH